MAVPLPVAVLVLPSVVPFDLGVPVQVFGYPRPDLGAQRYRMTVCAPRPGVVPTSGGFPDTAAHGLEALDATRAWALARLGEPLTVGRLAAHAGLPLRTFTRRLAAETGTSPLRWLLRARLAAAQEQLETTDEPVGRVAAACGFGSAASLRAHFGRELRTSPLAYRRALRAADGAP